MALRRVARTDHIPSMTGYSKPMIDFVRAIEPLAANFAGVKYTGLYTTPGFMDVQRILDYKAGKFEVCTARRPAAASDT